MKVIEHIQKSQGPGFSAELIPPGRGRSVRELIEVVEALAPIRPRWIDVTSHSSTVSIREDQEGHLRRKFTKKRPGTIGICGVLQNRFKIDTVAHILCLGFSREETEDALIELNYLGVENILALRGDGLTYNKPVAKERSVNNYACDLVEQIGRLKKGQFLEELEGSTPLDYCVGVAGYPEKHFEAANLTLDLQYLKKKVDAGADYIITQMFYDNEAFFRFVESARAAGITVPIIPGLKVLRTTGQLKSIPKTFHVNLPHELVEEIIENPSHVEEIGARWTERQVIELLEKNVHDIHFYVMQDASLVSKIVQKVMK